MKAKKLFFLAVLLGTLGFIGIFAFSYMRLQNKTAQTYFESGKKYFDQEKFSDATIAFLNALKRDVKHRDSRYYLALSYLGQENLTFGAQQLRALLEYYPDDIPANLKLAGVYLTAGPKDPEYYRQARDAAQRVLAIEPQNVAALILSGNSFAGLEDFDTYAELLNKAVSLDTKNVSGYISLGSTQTHKKKFAEAESSFLKAKQVDPNNKSVFVSLANYYRVAGSPEKAERGFREALSQYPADRAIYTPAVAFYIEQKRFEDAEKVLRVAQAASANDPNPTLDLADFYQSQNRYEDARNLLLQARTRFPSNVPLSIKLASNLMADKPDDARKEIDRVLKAEPKNVAGNVLLGELQFESGDFAAAAETFGKQEVLDSAFPRVHFLLGNIALQKGKIDEAQDHYQRSIKINKAYVPAQVALANLFLSKGRIADAQTIVRELSKLAASDLSVRLTKATVDAADKTNSTAEA